MTDSATSLETAFEWTGRVCPLCGSSRESRVFAESNIDLKELTEFAFASRKLPEYMHPRLVGCAECGMLYGNPVLSPGTLSNLYREAAFDSQKESRMASYAYRRILERHSDDLPDRRGAIDIGAGDGAFCERLVEMGFSGVVGVEPSAAPIAAAGAEIRKLLVHRLFRAEDFMPNSVSVISCCQVLEHVPAPLEIATAAFRILKPKGLFLVVVHNQRALSAKVLGLKSPIYDIEHLQLFTKESGRKLLESAGFRNVQVYPLWNRYPLQYWMRLFPFSPGMKNTLISLAKISGLGAIRISLPPGNIVLAAVKP
jgi:SAM-dependent methyltransferase